MTNSDHTPNTLDYHDFIGLYLAYCGVHGMLQAYLDLKLHSEQPAFVEGGEVAILHKLQDKLWEIDRRSQVKGLSKTGGTS